MPEWKLISVDDHIVEPPDVWISRLPAKLRDRAPHVVTIDGIEHWSFEGELSQTPGLRAVAGRRKEDFTGAPINFTDMRPGCYDPIARLEDMDRDGVLASLCFPSFPGFAGRVFSE